MRRFTNEENAKSLLIGVILGIGLIVIAGPYVSRKQAEQRAAEEAYLREYYAEVERERARWAEIENERTLTEIEQQEIAYALEMEKLNYPFDDPQIPDEIEEACRKWGEIYQIAPEFLESIAWQESRFDNEAKNGSCTGLMQISIPWHRDRIERLGYTEADMWDIEPNIAVAADYLAELFVELNDDYYVLMRYNGDSSADAFLNGTGEPSSYATEICTRAAVMTNYHEKGGAAWDNTN